MPRYEDDFRRAPGPRSRRVSEMGEWRNGTWVWYGDRSDPLNYGRQGPGGGYDRGYQRYDPERGSRPRDYDWEFARRRGTNRGQRYDSFARERLRRYDREYAARFRRPPEGAELKEFRREEVGPLWDR